MKRQVQLSTSKHNKAVLCSGLEQALMLQHKPAGIIPDTAKYLKCPTPQ